MSAYNFGRSRRNSKKFSLFNAEKLVLVNAVYILLLSSSVLEIFVVKLESCRTFFGLPNFKGAVPPKVVLALTPQPRGTSSAKVSLGYTPQLRSYKRSFITFKANF